MGRIRLLLMLGLFLTLLLGDSSSQANHHDNDNTVVNNPATAKIEVNNENAAPSTNPFLFTFLSELIHQRHFPVRSAIKSYVDDHLRRSEPSDSEIMKKNGNTEHPSIDDEHPEPFFPFPSSFVDTVQNMVHEFLAAYLPTTSLPSSSSSSTRSKVFLNRTEIFPLSSLANLLEQEDTVGIVLYFFSQYRLFLDTEALPLQYLRDLPVLNMTIPSIVYGTHRLTNVPPPLPSTDNSFVTVPVHFRTVDDALHNLVLATRLLHYRLYREETRVMEQQQQQQSVSHHPSHPEDYIQSSASLTLSSPTKESLQIIRSLLREYLIEIMNGVLQQQSTVIDSSASVVHPIMIVDFDEIYQVLNGVGTLNWKQMRISLDNFLYLLLRMLKAVGITSNGIVNLLRMDTTDPDHILQDTYPPWSILINPQDLSMALVDRYSNIRFLNHPTDDDEEHDSPSDIWGDDDETIFRNEWNEAIPQYPSSLFDFIHEHHGTLSPDTDETIDLDNDDDTVVVPSSKSSSRRSSTPSTPLFYEYPFDKDIVPPPGYTGSVYNRVGKIRYLRETVIHPLAPLWSMVYEDSLLTLSLLHLGRVQYQNTTHVGSVTENEASRLHPSSPPSSLDRSILSFVDKGVEYLESLTAYFLRETYVPKPAKSLPNYWNITLTSSPYPSLLVDLPSVSPLPRSLLRNDIEAYEILSMLSARGIEPARIVLGYRMFHGFNTYPVIPENEENRCTVALELIMTVSNIAVNDMNVVSRLIHDNEIAPLWEAHEDNQVQSLVTTNEVNAELLRNQADLGDVEAATMMGELLVHGHPAIGLRQDMDAAINYLQYAARNNGPARAGTTLAILMLDGMDPQDPRRNLTEAMVILRKAADEGNDDALSSLGYVYLTGNVPGEPRNVTLALEYLTRAADLGNINAQSNLASLYLGGNDQVPFNGTQARYWLEKAAAAGFTPAVFNLGLLELHGWDHPQNIGNCTAAFPHMLNVAYIGRMMDEYPWSLASSFSLHTKQAQRYGDGEGTVESGFEPVAINSEQALVHSLVLGVLGMEQAFDNAGFLFETQDRTIFQTVDGVFLPRINLFRTMIDTWYREEAVVKGEWFGEEQKAMIARMFERADKDAVYRHDGPGMNEHLPMLTLDSRYTELAEATEITVDGDADAVERNLSFIVSPKLAAYRYYRQSTNSSHALFRRAMCFAEEWDSVLPCAPHPGRSISSFNRTDYVLSLLTACMEDEDSHCTYTLAIGYATGRIGTIRVPVNVSHAWLLLDHCLLYDPMHTVPILTSKLWLLGKWFGTTGKEESSFGSLVTALISCLWEDADTNVTIPVTLKHPQKLSALLEYFDEDGVIDAKDGERISNYITLLYNQAFGPKYYLGPFPVSVADRHLCTLVLRTIVGIGMVGMVFGVSLMYITCSKTIIPPVVRNNPLPQREITAEEDDAQTVANNDNDRMIDHEPDTNESKED